MMSQKWSRSTTLSLWLVW